MVRGFHPSRRTYSTTLSNRKTNEEQAGGCSKAGMGFSLGIQNSINNSIKIRAPPFAANNIVAANQNNLVNGLYEINKSNQLNNIKSVKYFMSRAPSDAVNSDQRKRDQQYVDYWLVAQYLNPSIKMVRDVLPTNCESLPVCVPEQRILRVLGKTITLQDFIIMSQKLQQELQNLVYLELLNKIDNNLASELSNNFELIYLESEDNEKGWQNVEGAIGIKREDIPFTYFRTPELTIPTSLQQNSIGPGTLTIKIDDFYWQIIQILNYFQPYFLQMNTLLSNGPHELAFINNNKNILETFENNGLFHLTNYTLKAYSFWSHARDAIKHISNVAEAGIRKIQTFSTQGLRQDILDSLNNEIDILRNESTDYVDGFISDSLDKVEDIINGFINKIKTRIYDYENTAVEKCDYIISKTLCMFIEFIFVIVLDIFSDGIATPLDNTLFAIINARCDAIIDILKNNTINGKTLYDDITDLLNINTFCENLLDKVENYIVKEAEGITEEPRRELLNFLVDTFFDGDDSILTKLAGNSIHGSRNYLEDILDQQVENLFNNLDDSLKNIIFNIIKKL